MAKQGGQLPAADEAELANLERERERLRQILDFAATDDTRAGGEREELVLIEKQIAALKDKKRSTLT